MESSRDRRQLPDRRARPTTLWGALRWRGRRTGFRRMGEDHQAYVDCLAWPVMALAVFIYGCAIFDTLFTLLFLHAGGPDAHALLRRSAVSSPALMLAVKLGLTGPAVWVLAVHQQWPLARRGLYALALGYGAVFVSHLVVCWSAP